MEDYEVLNLLKADLGPLGEAEFHNDVDDFIFDEQYCASSER